MATKKAKRTSMTMGAVVALRRADGALMRSAPTGLAVFDNMEHAEFAYPSKNYGPVIALVPCRLTIDLTEGE